jgi:hypothetical protein
MSEFRNPYIQQQRDVRRDYRDRRNVEGYDRGALRDEYKAQRGEIRDTMRADKAAAMAAGTFNPWFKSDGFQTGAGMAMAAIQSLPQALDYGASITDSINEYRDMEFQPAEVMMDGVPVYGGVSDIGSQVRSIDINEAGKGLIGQGAATGASMGAAIGSAASPLGGLIGAGIGALAGTITGAFG